MKNIHQSEVMEVLVPDVLTEEEFMDTRVKFDAERKNRDDKRDNGERDAKEPLEIDSVALIQSQI